MFDCPIISVVDGDSLKCGEERLRLLGIDAPELHRCPSYRVCVSGDGQAAKRSLKRVVSTGPFSYRVVGYDRFGRSLVMAYAGKVNVACYQVRMGAAVYKPKWDNGGMLARECPNKE